LLEFKGKKVMLDFGIHPGLSGTNALPFIDRVDINTIDLLLISQYFILNII
jgi:cleavage and polyadenylation specificity factor subunit 3